MKVRFLIIPLPDPDWGVIRFNESLESINCGYYSAIDEAIASISLGV